MKKLFNELRPRIALWLTAVCLVNIMSSPLYAIEALDRFYTFGREILKSQTLNLWQDDTNSKINELVAVHPGDSTKTVTAAHDTLATSTIAKIVVKDPLVSNAAADSLDFHLANIERANIDSIYIGGTPIVGFSFGSTAGQRARFSYASIDTTVITGTQTVTGLITANGGVTSAISSTFSNGLTVNTLSSDATTETTSGTTGAIHTDGGLGVAKDIYLGDDLLIATGAVFNWDSGDVTLTHAANTLTMAGGSLGVGAAPTHDLYVYANDTSTEPMVYIEQEGTGDPAIGWMITGATAYMMGLDNDDSDYFKLAASNASLGTNTLWTVDTSGNTTIAGTLASGTVTVSSDLTLATGSITSASTAISFGDENLSTTGTLGAGATTVTTLTSVVASYPQIKIGDTVADATVKNTMVGSYHYTTAEEPVAMISVAADNGVNSVRIGGGPSQMNAATEVAIYSAANSTTTTGTPVVTINASGMNGTLGATTPAAATVTTLTASETLDSNLELISVRNASAGTAAFGRIVLGSDAGTTAGLDLQMYSSNHSTLAGYARILNQRNFPLQLGTGGSVNMTIAYGGSVGIGTATPEAKIHVLTADASVAPSTVADELVVEGTADTGISILAGDATNGYLIFGHSSNNAANYIQSWYNAGDEYMLFVSGGENTMAMRSGAVGIGTAAPDGTLHVHTATAGTVAPDAVADDLTIENSGNGGMSILVPDANIGRIFFGNPSDNIGGILGWDYSNAALTLGTSNAAGKIIFNVASAATAATIDASGNLGIGTASPGNILDIVTGATTSSALHIGEAIDEGAYITSGIDSQFFVAGGGEYVGGTFYARSTESSAISLESGKTLWYGNTSLTDGNSFTPTLRMTLDASGNLGLGVSAFGTSAAKVLGISSGTAPSSSPADMAQLWVEDVGGAGQAELRVRDELGNVATLSANVEAYPAEMAVSDDYPYVTLVEQRYANVRTYVSLHRMAELVQELAHREGLLAADSLIIKHEPLPAELREDWDAQQDANYDRRIEERNRIQNEQSAYLVKRSLALAARDSVAAIRADLTTVIDSLSAEGVADSLLPELPKLPEIPTEKTFTLPEAYTKRAKPAWMKRTTLEKK